MYFSVDLYFFDFFDILALLCVHPYLVLVTDNEVHQFFIRASDGTMDADVPVEVMVMGEDDVAPHFSVGTHQYFIEEDVLVGTIIATIPAMAGSTLSYSIIPGLLIQM